MFLQKITCPKKIFNENFILLLASFFGVRILSFLTFQHQSVQSLISFAILFIFGLIFIHNKNLAFIFLLGEFFLGGSGHFFEFYGLSIRLLLFISFIFLWLLSRIFEKKEKSTETSIQLFLIILLFSYLVFSSVLAFSSGNDIVKIIQDLIPFLFLLLFFPTYHFIKEKIVQKALVKLIAVFVAGTSFFSIMNFVSFSTGFTKIHDMYYTWARDVGMGKITDLGNGFFRIVFPEHLLVLPILLIFASLLMGDLKQKQKRYFWLFLIFCSIVMILNFSRIYFISVLIGLLVLKLKQKTFNWFKISTLAVAISIFIFFIFSFLASSGHSLGLDLLFSRTKSIVDPNSEISSATRMALLPHILDIIKVNPLLGNGLGTSIVFFDSSTNSFSSTNQFDWGYLELLAELGIAGISIFLALIFHLFNLLIKKIKIVQGEHKNIYTGILAGLTALLVTNTTSPTLFHIFGIFFIILSLSIASRPISIWEKITDLTRAFWHK